MLKVIAALVVLLANACAYGVAPEPTPQRTVGSVVPAKPGVKMQVCTPGATRCLDWQTEELCMLDGTQWVKVQCDAYNAVAQCTTDANGTDQCIIIK